MVLILDRNERWQFRQQNGQMHENQRINQCAARLPCRRIHGREIACQMIERARHFTTALPGFDQRKLQPADQCGVVFRDGFRDPLPRLQAALHAF